MQLPDVHHLVLALCFHFPLVREMQPLHKAIAQQGAAFHFPLVREMQRFRHQSHHLRQIFISRLYARCNCYRQFVQSRVGFFISRLYARCNASPRSIRACFVFSFPACTRDATFSTGESPMIERFSFPACTRDATSRRAHQRLYHNFHFPLVREMQLYGKKATKHAEGQSFLREPRFSRPASRNFPWASSMFGAGSRKQEQQKSRAFSRFPISPEQYDKHQEYTERKHHDTSFRE